MKFLIGTCLVAFSAIVVCTGIFMLRADESPIWAAALVIATGALGVLLSPIIASRWTN